MVIVEFTKHFEKEIKKKLPKSKAIKVVEKLMQTKPSDGYYISLIGDVLLKEIKMTSFRFYFIQKKDELRFLSYEMLKKHLPLFIEISKKDNQQRVVDKLKKGLKEFNFKL